MRKGIQLLIAFIILSGILWIGIVPAKASEKVLKKNYSVAAQVKGKKIYYNSKTKSLERKLKNGKYKKVSKNKVKEFHCVEGQYVYYTTKFSKLCRVKINGKKHKKYNVSVRRIETIRDGYIYYYNSRGFFRVSTQGKDEQKLLSYSNAATLKIVKDRIYYISTYIGKFSETSNPHQILTATLYSKKLDGTDRKMHKLFDGECASMIDSNDRYVFAAGIVGNNIEYIVLDTDEENPDTKIIFKQAGEGVSGTGHITFYRDTCGVVDGLWYYHDEQNIYTLDIQGKHKKFTSITNYETEGSITVVRDGKYLKIKDRYVLYIYKKDGTLAKAITEKYGKIRDSKIKKNKIVVTFYKNKKKIKRTFVLE